MLFSYKKAHFMHKSKLGNRVTVNPVRRFKSSSPRHIVKMRVLRRLSPKIRIFYIIIYLLLFHKMLHNFITKTPVKISFPLCGMVIF